MTKYRFQKCVLIAIDSIKFKLWAHLAKKYSIILTATCTYVFPFLWKRRFSEQYCVQVTIFTPIILGKFSNERKLTYQQLLPVVQWAAWTLCQCYSMYWRVMPKAAGYLSFSDLLHYLWSSTLLDKGTNHALTCLRQSWSFILFFLLPLSFFHFRPEKKFVGSILLS